MIDELLKFNGSFVESKGYENTSQTSIPTRKLPL